MYAEADDFAALYPDVDADEDWLAAALAQASDAVDMAFRARGLLCPAEVGDKLLLRCAARVCCQLVRRELLAQEDDTPADATSVTWSAGVYSRSYGLSGAGGNLRLNAADLAALGIAGGRVGRSGARDV